MTGRTVLPASRRPEGVRRRRQLGLAVVVLTLIGFLILGGFEAWHDSATFDEPVYVSSGVAAILHHDLADNAEHPPLFKVLAALPVLAVGPVVPADGHWNVNNERTYSARFVEAQMRAGTMHRVTFASRLVPLLECGAAGPGALRTGLPPLRCVGRASWPRCCGCSIPWSSAWATSTAWICPSP